MAKQFLDMFNIDHSQNSLPLFLVKTELDFVSPKLVEEFTSFLVKENQPYILIQFQHICYIETLKSNVDSIK